MRHVSSRPAEHSNSDAEMVTEITSDNQMEIDSQTGPPPSLYRTLSPLRRSQSDSYSYSPDVHHVFTSLVSEIEQHKTQIDLQRKRYERDIMERNREIERLSNALERTQSQLHTALQRLEDSQNGAPKKLHSVKDGYKYLSQRYSEVKRLEQSAVVHRLDTTLYTATIQKAMVKKISKARISASRNKMPGAENAWMEIEVAQRLCMGDNPEFVNVLEMLEDSSSYWIVSPYVRGGDLYDYIGKQNDGSLSLQQVRQCCQQLGRCVATMHKEGYCHNDLSLENVLRDPDRDTLKLIDFGAARKVSDANGSMFPAPAALRDRPGKASYRSPEIHNCEPFNGEKGDVWSLGVIFFTLALGRLPWKEPSKDDSHFRSTFVTKPRISGDPPTVRTLLELSRTARNRTQIFSDDFIDLLDGMLDVNENTRFDMSQVMNHSWITIKDVPAPPFPTENPPSETISTNRTSRSSGTPSFMRTPQSASENSNEIVRPGSLLHSPTLRISMEESSVDMDIDMRAQSVPMRAIAASPISVIERLPRPRFSTTITSSPLAAALPKRHYTYEELFAPTSLDDTDVEPTATPLRVFSTNASPLFNANSPQIVNTSKNRSFLHSTNANASYSSSEHVSHFSHSLSPTKRSDNGTPPVASVRSVLDSPGAANLHSLADDDEEDDVDDGIVETDFEADEVRGLDSDEDESDGHDFEEYSLTFGTGRHHIPLDGSPMMAPVNHVAMQVAPLDAIRNMQSGHRMQPLNVNPLPRTAMPVTSAVISGDHCLSLSDTEMSDDSNDQK